MTLTEFLLARIGDEENLARDAASEGTPHRTGWQLWTSKVDTTPGGELLGPRGSVEASPARVLVECAAKRQIVDLADEISRRTTSSAYWASSTLLHVLALPYADHPDYPEALTPATP
jgi:hypothetical protein